MRKFKFILSSLTKPKATCLRFCKKELILKSAFLFYTEGAKEVGDELFYVTAHRLTIFITTALFRAHGFRQDWPKASPEKNFLLPTQQGAGNIPKVLDLFGPKFYTKLRPS